MLERIAAALLWIVTAEYAAVAVAFSLSGRWPQALVFTGYCVANVGVIFISGRS